jgi:hypothetical protein
MAVASRIDKAGAISPRASQPKQACESNWDCGSVLSVSPFFACRKGEARLGADTLLDMFRPALQRLTHLRQIVKTIVDARHSAKAAAHD